MKDATLVATHSLNVLGRDLVQPTRNTEPAFGQSTDASWGLETESHVVVA